MGHWSNMTRHCNSFFSQAIRLLNSRDRTDGLLTIQITPNALEHIKPHPTIPCSNRCLLLVVNALFSRTPLKKAYLCLPPALPIFLVLSLAQGHFCERKRKLPCLQHSKAHSIAERSSLISPTLHWQTCMSLQDKAGRK